MQTSLKDFLDVELIGPFAKAAVDVFSTMLGAECRPGAIGSVGNGHRMHAVTSVIGLSGPLTGAISITTTKQGAIEILKRLTGIEATEVDDFVRDAVGEMANMIGGAGKKDLPGVELLLGLPQVIVGEDYCVYSPRWARHCWTPLQSEIGPCTLDVGFNITRHS